MYPSRSIHNIQQFVANMVPYIVSKGPSAREMNLLKRKAKINSKDQSKHWSEEGETDVACTPLVETPRGSGPDLLSSQKVLYYSQSFYYLFTWLPDLMDKYFLFWFYEASDTFLRLLCWCPMHSSVYCLFCMHILVFACSYVIQWSHYCHKRMLDYSGCGSFTCKQNVFLLKMEGFHDNSLVKAA